MTERKKRLIRIIRARLLAASERQLGLIAAFMSGLDIVGWSDEEYTRNV
jgi:hypothetical protein